MHTTRVVGTVNLMWQWQPTYAPLQHLLCVTAALEHNPEEDHTAASGGSHALWAVPNGSLNTRHTKLFASANVNSGSRLENHISGVLRDFDDVWWRFDATPVCRGCLGNIGGPIGFVTKQDGAKGRLQKNVY